MVRTRSETGWLAIVALSWLTACGGDDSSEELAGVAVELQVSARDSGEPIPGAEVTFGNGSDAAITNEQGIATLNLQPGQPLQVEHPTYLPLTVAGDVTDTVRVPLRPTPRGTRAARGALVGWDTLPEPGAGEYWVARIQATRPNHIGDLAEGLADGAAFAECRRPSTDPACEFELTVPAASNGVFGVVALGRDQGTPDDPSDDALEVVTLGHAPLPEGENSADIELLDEDQLAYVEVQLGAGTGAVSAPIGVPGLTVAGQVLVYPAFEGDVTQFAVPIDGASLSAGALWALGVAQSEATIQVVTRRGESLPTTAGESRQPLALGAFLDPPAPTVSKNVVAVDATVWSVRQPGSDRSELLVLGPGEAVLPTDLHDSSLVVTTYQGTSDAGDVTALVAGADAVSRAPLP